MLDSIEAIRFNGRMRSGRTEPCLLTGARDDAEEVELITKFSGSCDRGTKSLVSEAIAALLAADLGLPVTEPFLVRIDPDFIETISDVDAEQTVRRSSTVAFGSKKLPPGFSVLPTDKPVARDMFSEAAEIFAFDGLIQNADRRKDNPNCLSDGNSLAIYDHELSFIIEGVIGWQPPWQDNSLEFLRRHVFYDDLKGMSFSLERLEGAWEAISDERLAEYRNVLPFEWTNNDPYADEVINYISQVRENITASLAQVVRVLQ